MRLIFFFLLFSLKCNAGDIKRDLLRVFHWTDFEGSSKGSVWLLSVYLDDEQKISLEMNDLKQKTEYKMNAVCKNDSLIAQSQDGSISLRLKAAGIQEQSELSGYMQTSSTGKEKINLSFSFRSRSAGEADNRYFRLYGSDAEIEAFAAKIQQSLIEDNRVWISTVIQYPMNIEISPGTSLLIQTRQQFMDAYIKIFDQPFREKICSACSNNMKSDEAGVELGKGWIRINNTKKSDEKRHQLVITRISKN